VKERARVMGVHSGESEMDEPGPKRSWRRNKGSWFQRQGKA